MRAGILTWAAIAAIVLSFVSKLGAILQTIPVPVMGGILIILFGTVIMVGMNTLVESGNDLLQPRNVAIAGAILILGVGGASIEIGTFALEGIGLSSIIGVLLNLLLPQTKKL